MGTVSALPVDDDGNLPAALRALWDAIDRLTQPQGLWLENAWREAPCLLDQLIDDLAGQQGSQHGSHARSMPPMWIDATDLLEEINVALDAWSCGLPQLPRPRHLVYDVTARVQQLQKRPYRPQDSRALEQITATLKAWGKKIHELLNPVTKWSLPNPCPACGEATVYRKDSGGEPVRQPALQIGPAGCQCQNCRYVWEPAYFTHLARVLGYQLPAGVLE